MAKSGPFHQPLTEELRDPEFTQEYEAELQRLKGAEIMMFEGEIYKVVARSVEPGQGGIHLKGTSAYSHIGLTDEEAKSFRIGQRVRVTVEVVEG